MIGRQKREGDRNEDGGGGGGGEETRGGNNGRNVYKEREVKRKGEGTHYVYSVIQ